MSEVPEENNVNQLEIIGQQLKEAREKKGYSLNYVAEITRINLGVLRSIEEGKVEHSPGPVFVRGFIRTYAKLVGLDENTIQDEINSIPELGGSSSPSSSDVEPPPETNPEEGASWKKYVWVLILVGVIFIGYWGYEQLSSVSSPTEPIANIPEEFPEDEPIQTSEESEVTVAESDNFSQTAVAEDEILNETEVEVSPFQMLLEVKARELTWLGILADDESQVEVLLQPGEQIEWKAKERYQLTISNTKNVEVLLNGKPLEIDQSTDLLTDWVITTSMLE